MRFQVEVTSKEIIRPCSPTPNHLQHYQLSFLDQISPMVYNPTVLFYSFEDIILQFKSNTTTTTTISNHLKKSLSQVLTHFYPLAGRICLETTIPLKSLSCNSCSSTSFVHCNDDGVPFIETRVKRCKMSEVIHKPDPSELNHLVPFELDDVTNILLGVQLNVFECGGIAIGVCLSHQIADGLSFFKFLNSWAGIASGQGEVPNPQFISSNLFPPINTSGFDPRSGIVKENIVCKLFVFDDDSVESLRERYSKTVPKRFENYDDEIMEKPVTRVEALSAFIWGRYVAVTRSEGAERIMHAVVHAVNLRPKMEPPLPPGSFGNYYRITMTIIPPLNTGDDGSELVKQVRIQKKKIDKDYVRKLQEGNEHLEFMKDSSHRVLVKGELVAFNFTSLCRFPLYDADFGWGKPTWVGSPPLTFKNLVVFCDTKAGGGIEAYVSLNTKDMAKFEVDEEFLDYANKATTC